VNVRAALLRLHRWTGLVLAGFLCVAALTGIPLAWYDALDAAAAPALHRVTPPSMDAPGLDALTLRDHVARWVPAAAMPATPLGGQTGRSVPFPVWLHEEGAAAPVLHEVFVDPYSGAILGQRRWGDLGEGLRNLMPFLHRVHTALLFEGVGELLLGIVALAWTLDGFAGAWLTLPARPRARKPASSAWQRWAPAWRIRWQNGPHKRNFDLHRAGGLWLWAALTLMAWSSVALNLPAVYDPVMRAGLGYQADPRRGAPAMTGTPMTPWQAREVGRHLMADLAAREGFAVVGEHWLALDGSRGLYRYSVRSSRDLRTRSGATSVVFNAADGRLVGSHLPTGRAAGDTVKHWLTSLHMAALWGWPLQLAVAVVGAVTVVLSLTGVWLWWTRRRARQYGPLPAAAAATSLNSPASASAARASSTASTPTATNVAPNDR
jgi:uncharacterized iron-regulated membrane protein